MAAWPGAGACNTVLSPAFPCKPESCVILQPCNVAKLCNTIALGRSTVQQPDADHSAWQHSYTTSVPPGDPVHLWVSEIILPIASVWSSFGAHSELVHPGQTSVDLRVWLLCRTACARDTWVVHGPHWTSGLWSNVDPACVRVISCSREHDVPGGAPGGQGCPAHTGWDAELL